MADQPDVNPDLIGKAFSAIDELFGLPKDFLHHLMLETDDWSFVIKCHALLEAASCMLLSAHLAKPEIVDVLAEDVEMHSRIEMLKALNVTTAQERKMMRSLGKLRNRLVHNVTRTNFTFVDHLSDKNLRQDFAETYCLNWPDKIQIGGRPRPRSEFVLAQPRLAMWMSVVAFAMKTGKAQMQAQMDEKRRQMLEALRIAWEAAGDEPEEADESSEEQ